MKKQSIANRKTLDKIEKEDPERFEEIKRARKIRSAISALRLYANENELKETISNANQVLNFLKNNSNLSGNELKKLRLQTFKKKRGRPKQDK